MQKKSIYFTWLEGVARGVSIGVCSIN